MADMVRLLAIILLFAAAGCGPAPAGPSVTSPPAFTATAPPAVTSGPPFFTLAGPDPVLRHGGPESWFGEVVEPGAVILHDGEFHLFFNGFTGWPARAAVGRAVSPDGVNWEPVPGAPLLDSNRADFEGFTFFISSVIELETGDWVMYLYTLDEGRDGAPGGILAATAAELAGPWELRPGYVLSPGEAGSWDASRVTQPHVLRIGAGYRMYFSGYENDRLQGARAIGIASSPDGLAWEKSPAPVFTPSEELGAWDGHRVFQPRVLQTGDGFLMLYKANVSVGRAEAWGFATSLDGLAWERHPGNPLFEEGTYGIDFRRNGIAELIEVDGDLLLYLEVLERNGGGYHHGNADYRSNIFLFNAPAAP
jgi:predicted GH43/DUF377 family glycosyl hydrolase